MYIPVLLFSSRQIMAAACALSVITASSVASATTIDFEGWAQPNGAIAQVANGTGGFDWLGVYASNPEIVTNKPNGQNTGLHNGVVSGDEIGFSQYGYSKISNDIDFTLNSLYLTSAYKNNRSLSITGFNDAAELFSTNVILGIDQPTLVKLDWSGIDALVMQWAAGSTGEVVAGFPTGNQFAFDDIVYNEPVAAVPAPGTAWLFGSALLGLIGATRRSKKSVLRQ